MQNERVWKGLLERLEVEGKLNPVSEKALANFEANSKIALPRSYRESCRIFGPGSLRARKWIDIAVPGLKLPNERCIGEFNDVSIEALNNDVWRLALMDLDEYSSDPQLLRNGLYFGCDIATHHYFFNKSEITNRKSNEMAVYVVHREWDIHRLADSFESFILNVCLKEQTPDEGQFDNDPPRFRAASIL